MKLNIDVTDKVFSVADDPAPKRDGTGKHRTDKKTGYPMWTTQLFVRDEDGGSVIDVVTCSPEVPNLEPGDDVDVYGLFARHWSSNGKQGINFHADKIVAVEDDDL